MSKVNISEKKEFLFKQLIYCLVELNTQHKLRTFEDSKIIEYFLHTEIENIIQSIIHQRINNPEHLFIKDNQNK